MEKKQNKNSFGVLIPVHQITEKTKTMILRAVKSVPSDIVVYVVCYDKNKDDDFSNELLDNHKNLVTFLADSDAFSGLVNYGIKKFAQEGVEWVSILEMDDEFNSLWFNEVKNEISDKPDVSVFLPLSEIIDWESGKFISYGNEAPWASSFSNEIGYVDNDSLQQFFDFYLTGGVFNTRDWEYVGGLKESIKLSFWYEFLLRMTHNDKKIYVVPKLGYKHYVNREDSLFSQYKETMSEDERKWWYELALEQYAYRKDNKKTYE
jgi:hypothetical protein